MLPLQHRKLATEATMETTIKTTRRSKNICGMPPAHFNELTSMWGLQKPLLLLLLPLLLMLLPTCSSISHISHSDDNFDVVADGLTALHMTTSNNKNNNVDMLSQRNDDNLANNNTSGALILRRGKRYLEFSKGSRMSWRLNCRNNLLTINSLISYGFGFRANYPFPDPKEQRRMNRILFKRDLFQNLETALDGHGFDGKACLLKSFCTALLDVDTHQKSGMLLKMLKLIFSCMGNSTTTHKRSKRYLDILETSRIFVRVNAKNNVIASPTIWAHGFGFRANTPILVNHENRPFRRDTYAIVHELMERSGFDGQACALKLYCTAHAGGIGQGFLLKLLKYIFTLEEHEKHHLPHLRAENCQQLMHSHCPLSFDSISPYTDDV